MKINPKYNDLDIQTKIILAIADSETHLYLHQIAKNTNLSAQIVEYNLKKLIKEGILLKEEYNDKIVYDCQPCFKLANRIKLLELFLPIFQEMYVHNRRTRNPSKTLTNCMEKFMGMFVIDLK